jgi:ApaG protein
MNASKTLSGSLNVTPTRFASEASSHAVRVRATPTFLASRSDPDAGKYIFGYTIRISNESERAVRVLRRRWTIVDASGHREEVEGEGVVGQQPRLEPGQTFEYQSFCALRTRWGTMEGQYELRSDEGEALAVPIGRFFLVSDAE